MRAGRLVQADAPYTLYRSPVDADVARFVGGATTLPAHVSDGVASDANEVRIAVLGTAFENAPAWLVDIAEKLAAQIGFDVDRRKIDLDEPIKRIGIYPIKIRLMAGLEPLVNVVVEGEEGAIQLPPDPDAAE